MSDLRKAAEMALEALCVGANDAVPNDIDERFEQAINALRQALAQPEQEPFEYWNAVEGWVTVDREEVFDGRAKQKMMQAAMKQTSQQYRDDPEVMFATGWYAGFHSRTTGPKREWVGLTDEEKVAIYQKANDENWHDQPLLEAVEAKLKEKNG